MLNKLNSESKKILLVIDNLGSGGAQNQLTLLAVGLKQKGYDVSVFTYFPQDFFKNRLISNQIKHFEYQKTDKLGFGVIRALAKILKKEQFDSVISFLDTPNFYAALAKKWSFSKAKLIISYRSKTEFEKLSWSAIQLKKWVNRQANVIVSNSEHERKYWQTQMPKISYKFYTISNAVEGYFFTDNQVKNKQNNLLVIGSVSSDKNGLLIIEALQKLKQESINVNLTWVGQKVYHIPERHAYLQEMEKKINIYQLDNQWNWRDSQKDVKTLYETHSTLILASKVEGLPNVVCEALACGLPCIVSDVLDHPNLVFPNKNGFLFNPDESESLKNAIVSFQKMSENDYQKMCKEAQVFAHKTFSINHFVAQYETVI